MTPSLTRSRVTVSLNSIFWSSLRAFPLSLFLLLPLSPLPLRIRPRTLSLFPRLIRRSLALRSPVRTAVIQCTLRKKILSTTPLLYKRAMLLLGLATGSRPTLVVMVLPPTSLLGTSPIMETTVVPSGMHKASFTASRGSKPRNGDWSLSFYNQGISSFSARHTALLGKFGQWTSASRSLGFGLSGLMPLRTEQGSPF